MFSTSHFQSGALAFAKTHGIALVFVTEGRLTIERRSADDLPPLSKEVAEEWGVEPIAGTYFGMGDSEGSTACAYIGPDSSRLTCSRSWRRRQPSGSYPTKAVCKKADREAFGTDGPDWSLCSSLATSPSVTT